MDAKAKTILIVDDTPENLTVLNGILSGTYKVKAAPGGRIALKIAQATPPDLIFLDIMMPEIDGYGVLEELKKNSATAGVPVVFVSAKDESADRARALAAGAADYLTKPVDPAKVLKAAAVFTAIPKGS